jgi:hypothetical protein
VRIRRSRSLQIETLEGKIFLSSGTANPAKSLDVTAAKPFAFNGTLYVGFAERSSASSNESEFYAFIGKDKEPFKPMGTHVQMAGPLAHPQLLPPHAFPDLNASTLSLVNSKGSLSVTFSSSEPNAYSFTNGYDFTISAGTGRFVSAPGTDGSAILANGPHGYQIAFKSVK